MFGIGLAELIFILVIVFIIFGAGKLPEVCSSLGKGIRCFKKAAEGIDDTRSIHDKEEEKDKENKEETLEKTNLSK